MGAMRHVTFSLHNALTQWQAGPFALCTVAVLIGLAYLYLRADWQLAAKGRRWPRGRVLAFLAGLFAIDLAIQSPVATFTGTYFQAHVVQHLLLMVVAPPLLALSAPSTLMLQTASRRTKVAWLKVLRSRPFTVLTHPLVVWALYFGIMFAFFLSSLINVAMHHMFLMDIMNVVFLFGACLYWWPMVGLDPIIHWKMGYGARMVNILLGGPPEVILGLAIISSQTPIASMYTLASTHAGGGLLWISTEFAIIGGFIPIFLQWARSDERAANRADARALAMTRAAQPATADIHPDDRLPVDPMPAGGRSPWDFHPAPLDAELLAASGLDLSQIDPDLVDPSLLTASTSSPEAPADAATPVAATPPAEKGLTNWEAMWLMHTGRVPSTRPDGSWDTTARVRKTRIRTRPLQLRAPRKRSVQFTLGAVAFVALVTLIGPAVFFHFVEGKAPGRLSLPPANGVQTSSIAAGPVSGTWAVGPGSQAGYRVDEILFGQHHTAVGRTSDVSGGLVISGTTVTAADFSVDLAAVKSDQPSRDVQFHGYIMETFKYHHATFRLMRPIDLGTIPPAGRAAIYRATGQLSMRGVTRTVTFSLQAERVGSKIDMVADIPIIFSQWRIPNPSFAIAQVGNTGTIEVLLDLAPHST
jgi:putative copper resistance protein D